MKTSIQTAVITYLLLAASYALAAQVLPNDDKTKIRVVNAIIGEAEGEPYRGKLAVACAIRNRGSLQGVYGEKSRRVKERLYSSRVFVDAVRAYEESADPEACRFIGGADHWEGTAFKTPAWAKDMQVTVTIGRQRFYKTKQRGRE